MPDAPSIRQLLPPWICWFGDALLVKVTSFSESDVIPMILFTVGGFGPTIAACVCMEGGFSKKNLKRFLFSNSKKNWSFLIAAIILETLAFYISSNGVIESIPTSPIAVIVGLVIFLQATILFGGNEKRLAEDAKISEIIGVKYSNLGVELMDDLYHDFFKEYGGNAELKEDNVLDFYVNRLGEEKVVELATALNAKLDFFRSKGYQIICPLGIGHPFHYLVKLLIV